MHFLVSPVVSLEDNDTGVTVTRHGVHGGRERLLFDRYGGHSFEKGVTMQINFMIFDVSFKQ